jgi:glycosyltransferase involved in cell wall biosynthesis
MAQLNPLVTIIVRTTPRQYFSIFTDAIKSIYSNIYRPIEIIIVIQSESDDFVKSIKNFMESFSDNSIFFQFFQNKSSGDQRTKNLNIGLRNAQGRFIGFLDDDDILYPNHINTLIENLLFSNHAWAYSDTTLSINQIDNDDNITIVSNKLNFKKNQFSLDEFIQDNFIPIHSYIIDTNKVSKEELNFDESLIVLEDYAFLLNLVAKTYPLYIPIITCEYRMFTDASNTNFYINQYLGVNYHDKVQIWIEAQQKVEILKQQLFPSYKPSKRIFKNIKFYLSKFAFLYKIRRIIKSLVNKILL